MCTSITVTSADNKHLLARTMDFSFQLDPEMVVFPRNFALAFDVAATLTTHYAFLGLAKDVGNYYIADGINEFGLSGAALYFEGYAVYSPQTKTSKAMVAPHELVMWILANCKTIEDVQNEFTSNIVVVEQTMGFLGTVPPLHWVFQDSTGSSIVVEVVEEGVKFYQNNLGILTNSPDYPWHMTNVRNYIGLDPMQVKSRTLYGQQFNPFGQGSGTFGLPGDFTPPSRFIKTLYNKLSVKEPSNAANLVLAATHVLNGVDIPLGSVVTPKNTIDYTQYTSYMLSSDQIYYFRMHDSLSVIEVQLSDYNLDASTVFIVNM